MRRPAAGTVAQSRRLGWADLSSHGLVCKASDALAVAGDVASPSSGASDVPLSVTSSLQCPVHSTAVRFHRARAAYAVTHSISLWQCRATHYSTSRSTCPSPESALSRSAVSLCDVLCANYGSMHPAHSPLSHMCASPCQSCCYAPSDRLTSRSYRTSLSAGSSQCRFSEGGCSSPRPEPFIPCPALSLHTCAYSPVSASQLPWRSAVAAASDKCARARSAALKRDCTVCFAQSTVLGCCCNKRC